jgi:hypothetical protein
LHTYILVAFELRDDFNMGMSRFIPNQIKERTLDNPEYWTYVQPEISAIAMGLIKDNTPKNKFTKPSLIYKKTKNLRACQLLLGHTKLKSTVRYLGIEVDDALEVSEGIDS